MAITVAETLTGLSNFPWLIFYYTLGGYEREATEGLPPFW